TTKKLATAMKTKIGQAKGRIPPSYINRVFGSEKRSCTEIRCELEDTLDEAGKLVQVVESGGDPTVTEGRWNELMGDQGDVKSLQNELVEAEACEEEIRQRVLAQSDGDYSLEEITGTAEQGNNRGKKMKMLHPKLNAFKDQQDAYDCGQWLKATIARSTGGYDERAEKYVQKSGLGFQATATEGAGSAGGYTVPDPLAQAIIESRFSTGISRQLSDVRPMSADTLNVPKQTAGPTVYYPGEANAITPSDATWGQVGLTAVKRAVLSKVSNELADD
ncbi:unnamed protein product, partial [marine sediment metagenome]